MIATLCILSKTQSALAQVEGYFLNYRARKQVAVSRVTSATNLVSFCTTLPARTVQLCSRVREPPCSTRNSNTLGSVRVRRCEPITCLLLVSRVICVLRCCPRSRQMLGVVCVWSHSRISVWRCRCCLSEIILDPARLAHVFSVSFAMFTRPFSRQHVTGVEWKETGTVCDKENCQHVYLPQTRIPPLFSCSWWVTFQKHPLWQFDAGRAGAYSWRVWRHLGDDKRHSGCVFVFTRFRIRHKICKHVKTHTGSCIYAFHCMARRDSAAAQRTVQEKDLLMSTGCEITVNKSSRWHYFAT